MVMTESAFAEIVTFVNTHPEWRVKLLNALFPDIDIAKAFQDLAESQREMKALLQQLTNRVDNIEADVAVLKTDVAVLKTDVAVLKTDVANLTTRVGRLEDRVERGFAEAAAERSEMKKDISHIKGFNYESRIVQRADAIFGRFMRRGRDVRNEVGLLLEEAEENGLITEKAHDHVLALDLLWGGKQKRTKADVVLAVEISWRAEEFDIKRAVSRAETLRAIGLNAIPTVASLVWDEPILALAREQQAVCVIDMTLDDTSWS